MKTQKLIKASEFEKQTQELSAEKKKEISSLINKAFKKSTGNDILNESIKEDVYQDFRWNIYEGDLVIEGNFHSDLALIITGNLIINGSYIEELSVSDGGIIVLGDFKVEEHIISQYPMFVAGKMTAQGLIYLHYNVVGRYRDYYCTFLNDIICDILFIDDRPFEMCNENIEAKFYYNSNFETKGDRKYIQKLKDEFLDELDEEEWDDESVDIYLDFCKIQKFILEEKSIYK